MDRVRVRSVWRESVADSVQRNPHTPPVSVCVCGRQRASKWTEVAGCFACMRRPVISLACNLLHPSCNLAFWAPRRTPSIDHAPEPLTIVDSLYWARQRHLGVWRQRGDHQELGRHQENQRPLRRQAEPALTSSVSLPTLASRARCVPTQPSHHVAPRGLSMHAPSAGEFYGTEFMPGDRVPQRRRNPPLGTAPARVLGCCASSGRLWAGCGTPRKRPPSEPLHSSHLPTSTVKRGQSRGHSPHTARTAAIPTHDPEPNPNPYPNH